MTNRAKLSAAMLLACCGAAMPALAQSEAPDAYEEFRATPYHAGTVTYYSNYGPETRTYYYPSGTTRFDAPAYYEVIAPSTPPVTYVEPPVTYASPPITVYGERLDEDSAITADVMDSLAADPRLSGRTGVETHNNHVTLTGQVRSPLQVDIAGSNARRVPGVRDVENRIQSRMGSF